MKFKIRLIFLFGTLAVGLMIGSCKKTSQNYISTLFTTTQWQLSSVTVTYYIGSSQINQVSLDTACNLVQTFKFNPDNTCTYTNFDCLTQSVKGSWSLSQDQLFLYADMVCQDTTAAKSSKPFQTARIINLGQYSMILQTGDLQTYYPPTQARTVYQWGFVRVKSQ